LYKYSKALSTSLSSPYQKAISLLRKILFKDKLEDKPSYVISFSFFEGENLNFAYNMEKNEARRVLRRIKSFLEKEKIYS